MMGNFELAQGCFLNTWRTFTEKFLQWQRFQKNYVLVLSFFLKHIHTTQNPLISLTAIEMVKKKKKKNPEILIKIILIESHQDEFIVMYQIVVLLKH